MPWGSRAVLAAAALAGGGTASAAKLIVKLDGIEGGLQAAALATLELVQYENRDVSAAQVRRLYERADEQVAAALEPYGYYDVKTNGSLDQAGDVWTATLHVAAGEPVTVGKLLLKLDGPAAQTRRVRQALDAFAPREGQRLDHAAYERGKTAIQAALFASGFLDAQLIEHRVEVERASRKATIRLAWEPGERYRFGPVSYTGGQFPSEFLARYQPWREGDYYSQDRLLGLQRRLTDAEYFAVVDVRPDVEHAADGVVPILVDLAPAKRSIYTGGIFVGTDTGGGVRGGVERRWVNSRGHKLKTELILAQRLKSASALYVIPLPGTDDRSYNFGVNYKDENTRSSQSKTASVVANETRQWRGFTRTLGLHLVTGDFSFGDLKGNSTTLYPEVSLTRKRADDPLFVRKGYSLSLLGRAAKADLLSDTDFAQVRADAKWVRGIGDHQRFIARGTFGTSWVNDFDALPPDLRFFAGGDRSIRGYGYQAIGPRETVADKDNNEKDQVIGGKSLVVASAEYEYYFKPKWGVATFVDAGDAFSGTGFAAKVGAGIGLRWLSPVGMVRLDVAAPVGDRHADGVQLHLVIGPDL